MLFRVTLATLLVGLAAISFAQGMAPMPPPRTISVTGAAERSVPPDLGTVVLAIQTQASTVARAVQQNNGIANSVMEAIRKLNLNNLTMRTMGFDVTPMYEQPEPGKPMPNPPKIVGYQVTNRLEVKVPEANTAKLSDNVGRVLDTALAAGANRVDSVSFTLQNEQPVMLEVLAQATRNAAQTASTLANAASVALGPLMTLNASPYYQPPMPMYAARAMEASAVPIAAGELTVRATVNAVYAIQ